MSGSFSFENILKIRDDVNWNDVSSVNYIIGSMKFVYLADFDDKHR